MYVDIDSKGKVAIHDLTPMQAFVISMIAQTHGNIKSFYSQDEQAFLQLLSQSIDLKIFNPNDNN